MKIGDLQTDRLWDVNGQKDAFHVPGIVVTFKKGMFQPGDYVKFGKFYNGAAMEKTTPGEAEAILDPFVDRRPLEELAEGKLLGIYALFFPGRVTNLQHVFDLDQKKDFETFKRHYIDDCVGCGGQGTPAEDAWRDLHEYSEDEDED